MSFPSISGKKWIFKQFDNNDIKNYTENYSLSEIVAKLISIRKKNISDINLFLKPTIKDNLPNPLKLKDMQNAIDRTYKALLKNEIIGIFGDYDVDGATSTALLSRYFLSINRKIETYIPDRKKEGYGPSVNGFNNLMSRGAKIIFTVDCGTLSFEPVSLAQKSNIDVIILDHHQSDINIPKACAVINPNRHDDNSKLNYLCAAGVCFMYLVALNKKLREKNWFIENNILEPNILNLLDLVSLGTVCDVVPLIGLNRAIVKQGLKVLKKRTNLGLKTLYDLCKIKSQPSTFDLGYILGPRINAGGRVGRSSHGAELLTSEDPSKAYRIALDLEKYNTERKSIEMLLSEEVNDQVKKYYNDPVLVLSNKNWHEGIIGIVASRIKDKYCKPTIIISIENNKGKGSARSILGFDIGTLIIKSVQLNILEKGGGHKMAGGFVIEENKIELFRDFLIKNYNKMKINTSELSNIYLDTIIAPSAINENFYNEIEKLSPFGPGNSEPKFMVENLSLVSSYVVKNNHIKSILRGNDGSIIKSFAWNAMNSPLESILNKKNKRKINIAGKMKKNEWMGKKDIEFIIEDASLS